MDKPRKPTALARFVVAPLGAGMLGGGVALWVTGLLASTRSAAASPLQMALVRGCAGYQRIAAAPKV
jgi:hypothetical protein